MDDREIPPVLYALAGLRAAMEIHARTFASVVDELGAIEGTRTRKVSRAGSKHDFVLFCTTKFCTTVSAENVLIDQFFAEETYPLTRTVYEHYLALASVVADDANLDNFLSKPVGLLSGVLTHPLSRKGKPIRRDIVYATSGRRISGIASVREMACATGYKYDPTLHDILYNFLSRHTHPTIVASANYWDDANERFTYSSQRGLLEASFWACFVSAIAVAEVAKAVLGSKKLRGKLRKAKDASNEALHDALDVVVMTGEFVGVPDLIRSRLKARRRR